MWFRCQRKNKDSLALASKGRMGAQAPKVADCALQFLFEPWHSRAGRPSVWPGAFGTMTLHVKMRNESN